MCVDLEHHRVVYLLPERSADAVATGLHAHPGGPIVSRDRGGEFAEGAKRGAPEALQVADRFHLLRNLGDVTRRARPAPRRARPAPARAQSVAAWLVAAASGSGRRAGSDARADAAAVRADSRPGRQRHEQEGSRPAAPSQPADGVPVLGAACPAPTAPCRPTGECRGALRGGPAAPLGRGRPQRAPLVAGTPPPRLSRRVAGPGPPPRLPPAPSPRRGAPAPRARGTAAPASPRATSA